jgi:hypothetical protein
VVLVGDLLAMTIASDVGQNVGFDVGFTVEGIGYISRVISTKHPIMSVKMSGSMSGCATYFRM